MNLIKILSTVNPSTRLLTSVKTAQIVCCGSVRGLSRRNQAMMTKLGREMHLTAQHQRNLNRSIVASACDGSHSLVQFQRRSFAKTPNKPKKEAKDKQESTEDATATATDNSKDTSKDDSWDIKDEKKQSTLEDNSKKVK